MLLRCVATGLGWCVLTLGLLLASRAAAQLDAGVDAGSQRAWDAGSVFADAGGPPLDAASVTDRAIADGSAVPDAGSAEVVPPRLLASTPPVFPAEKQGSGEHPTVVLKVTVFADGSLGDVVVEHSAGPLFDEAARAAVRTWSFAPAQRGGTPIASRVGVAVHFELPELGVHEVTALGTTGAAVPHAHPLAAHSDDAGAADAEAPDARVFEDAEAVGAHARVAGNLRNEQRSAADIHLSSEVLRSAPSQDSSDLLKRAPGMVVARIEGDAVTPHLMLRGFDADHGQDIELSADGVPLNQPSHIHGQGYVELGHLIPETVRGLHVSEGVYDPRQGDFAVAGSADFELGVERRGLTFSSGFGSFHTYRELALYAPEGFGSDTFGAAMVRKTQGFGQNRAALSGSAVGQIGFDLGRVHFTLHGSLYAARARTANVLRRDDIDAGNVGFYDVYPLATARAQGANAQRGQVSLRARYHGQRGENAELNLFFVQNDFRLQANYTGFSHVSAIDPNWSGRGDLIEQRNQDRMLGFKGRYRSAEFAPSGWARAFLEIGAFGRFNMIDQSQNLVEAPAGTIWDRQVDASVAGTDVGGYLDADLTFKQRLHLRGGVRADVINYRISDALGHPVTAEAPDHVPGYSRGATGLALGPRAMLEFEAARGLSLVAAYGEGYRSAMALLLRDGQRAPFAKVRSGDIGLKYSLDRASRLSVRASAFLTQLRNDVAFEPEEGRPEPIGPSRRDGFSLYAEGHPFSWAFASVSATYVHASLQKPPAPSDEDPPEYRPGRRLPYVPSLVIRADLQLSRRLTRVRGHELSGRVGGGYTYWSSRPLPYGSASRPVSLVDLEGSLTWRMFRFSLSCFNLLNTKYAALELNYPSNWSPDAAPSSMPARQVMAGAPRTLLGTLEIQL